MTYRRAIDYLQSFINYENSGLWSYKKSVKLKRFADFLSTFDDPQDALRCVHVSGTKGKGSVCAFIAHMLRSAGYATGLYTSPHLSDFRERIRILRVGGDSRPIEFEGMISRNELTRLVEYAKPFIERFNKASSCGSLTFFEIYTALAFLYFKHKKVDFAVLETGMGGRLDATNVVSPLVCAITSISFEHTHSLGNTLGQIANEKAGIIKSGYGRTPVISAPQKAEVRKAISLRCKKVEAQLYEVGKDIIVRKISDRFAVRTPTQTYQNLKVRLLGQHQLINASVAVGVIEALRQQGFTINSSSVRKGLKEAFWPGRCEIVARNPLVILDGAQNADSTKALIHALQNKFKYKDLILVLGISNDKDIKGICTPLRKIADTIVLTKSNNPRASDPYALARFFKAKEVHFADSVKNARKQAMRLATKNDLILVCGSLFVVGEYRHEQIRQ